MGKTVSQPPASDPGRPRRRRRLRRRPTAAFVVALLLLVLVAIRLRPQASVGVGLPPANQPLRVERVVDGDTLLLATGHRVRLLGVDTPETKDPDRPPEPLGTEATEFTRAFVDGKSIRLEYDRERLDNYRRVLAYVFVDDRLLNAAIIEAGFSRAETRFPYRADRKRLFEEAEAAARAAGRGLWSLPPQATEPVRKTSGQPPLDEDNSDGPS